ncbi:MAG TPA: hypothetical protein VHY09_11665 [Candidatus Methylacidiphilales bacterium]|nr:hypothetical protein [Candidatus Methylacidiphilales bacterium]
MSDTDVKSWVDGLPGRHVFATDISGRVYSGTVQAVETTAGTPALNIGGHLVSLSQLKQVSWSPAIA